MKKSTFIFSLLALFLITAVSVKASDTNVLIETREVSNFHGITSAGSFNIEVTMGKKESLEIDADESDLERIETLVQNGTLRIRLRRDAKNYNIPFKRKVNIYITAKKLDALAVSGSGNLEVKGIMDSASTNLQLSGSGSITAQVETQNVSLLLSGSGNVNLSGETGNSILNVSGSGNVNAQDLVAKTTKVNIGGSGNVVLHSEESLVANLAGSGSVKYLGSPELQVNTLGSGRVTKLD